MAETGVGMNRKNEKEKEKENVIRPLKGARVVTIEDNYLDTPYLCMAE